MATKTPVGNLPTRETLMRICNGDLPTVRAFELLFASVRTILPDAIDSNTGDLTGLTSDVNGLKARSYVVATHAALTPNDRVLTGSGTVSVTDGGAGSNITLQGLGNLLNVRTITTSGTYTPTAGTARVVVYAQGAGGQGGGTAAAPVTNVANAAGGNAGGQAIGFFTSGFSGVTITIGTGGSTGTAGNAGQAGTATTFGALMSAGGGAGGPADAGATANHFSDPSGTLATVTGGNIANIGGPQANAGFSIGLGVGRSGRGGISQWGAAGAGRSTSGTGGTASGFGTGGGGALSLAGAGAAAGGPGAPGVVVIYEYS